MTDSRQLRSVAESGMTREDQQNAGGMRRVETATGFVHYDQAPLSEYPRMLYRKTTVPQTQPHADELAELKDPPMVINSYDGMLCDTIVANSADDAEKLAVDGWDISPHAAHGKVSGIVAATTAKDDEIAALKAQLAAMSTASSPEKRGPGRPPKAIEEPVA